MIAVRVSVSSSRIPETSRMIHRSIWIIPMIHRAVPAFLGLSRKDIASSSSLKLYETYLNCIAFYDLDYIFSRIAS